MSIFKPEQILANPDKITFSKVKQNKYGGNIVYIRFNGEPLYLQTPEMYHPYGVSTEDVKDKDGTVQVGNFITARARKSRFTRENSAVEIYLNFKTGINKYHGLVPFAIKAGVFQKVGARYTVPDGRKLYEKQIMADPEEFFTQEVLEKINAVIHEEFSYGEFDPELEKDIYEEPLDDLHEDIEEV